MLSAVGTCNGDKGVHVITELLVITNCMTNYDINAGNIRNYA